MLGWGTASGEVRLMKSQTNSEDNEFLVKKQIANQLINKHIVDNSIFFDSWNIWIAQNEELKNISVSN